MPKVRSPCRALTDASATLPLRHQQERKGVMLDLLYLGLGLAAVGLFVAYAAALKRL
jgi:hypothetical protein